MRRLAVATLVLAGCGRVGFSLLPDGDSDGDALIDSIPATGCVRQVTTGLNHTCAVRTDGDLYCWGGNTAGELGVGTVSASLAPIEVFASGTQLVFMGPRHGCAARGTDLSCWGANLTGQLGDGTTDERSTPRSITGPASGLVVTAGDAGENFTCVIIAGDAWCWGDNQRGQLGDGTSMSHKEPAPIADGGQPNFSAIALGSDHACAIGVDNTVWCWGGGDDGELGNGSIGDRPLATQIPSFTAVAVAAGADTTCAHDGTNAYCWGEANNGQLGNDATLQSQSSPAAVALGAVPGIVSIATGGVHACAVITDGTVRCWGRHNGRLGDGDPTPTLDINPTPVTVSNLNDAVQVSLGIDSSCARRVSGAVECWGQNDDGELARGSYSNSSVPIASSVSGSTTLAMGGFRACSIDSSGGLTCWGSNADGELGTGGAMDANAPVYVASGVRDAAAGTSFTCAAFEDGNVRCWGKPTSGRLGIGTPGSSPRSVPTLVQAPGLTDATSVSAGLAGGCAVDRDGETFCWGGNTSGQIGDNTTTLRNAPVATAVPGGGVIDVQSGEAHTCARTAADAWCWGAGGGGRLGTGNASGSLVPVMVVPPTTWIPTVIAVGETHSCAHESTGHPFLLGPNTPRRPRARTSAGRTDGAAGGPRTPEVLRPELPREPLAAGIGPAVFADVLAHQEYARIALECLAQSGPNSFTVGYLGHSNR